MRTHHVALTAWLLARGHKPKARAIMRQPNGPPRTVWIFKSYPKLFEDKERFRINKDMQNAMRMMSLVTAASIEYTTSASLSAHTADALPVLVNLPVEPNEIRYRKDKEAGSFTFIPGLSLDNACLWMLQEGEKEGSVVEFVTNIVFSKDDGFSKLRYGQRFMARSIAPAMLIEASDTVLLAMMEGLDLLSELKPTYVCQTALETSGEENANEHEQDPQD